MRKNKRCQHRQFSTPPGDRAFRLFESEAFGKLARDSSMTRNKRIGGNPDFFCRLDEPLASAKNWTKGWFRRKMDKENRNSSNEKMVI